MALLTHGLLDIAYLRAVPNIAVMAPKDEGEMRDMLLTMIEHVGPAAMRYRAASGVGDGHRSVAATSRNRKGEILRDRRRGPIIAYADGSSCLTSC